MADKEDAPYKPAYKGFDEERTRNAQATAERAREGASAAGEDANWEYMEGGEKEYTRRTGDSPPDVEGAVKRSNKSS